MRASFMAVMVLVLVSTSDLKAQYSRKTPIVEAVKKSGPGVVNLKVAKQGDWGNRTIQGTGVIIDERGYLITNAHVVDSALSITATLSDKTILKGTVVAEIPSYDLAIVRLATRKNLKALTFGTTSDLMVGETVIAIGNPFGYANTVTTGIVSGLDREVTMPAGANLKGLIQTNCPINPGNSGGPLLNINGEVIGINVALREGAQNIAFAINADTVKAVLKKHLSAARLSKIEHGLTTKDELKGDEGKEKQAVVVQTAKGAVKKGDVIVKLASLNVANSFDVERALWGYKAGDKVKATVLRGGKKTEISLTLRGATQVTSLSSR